MSVLRVARLGHPVLRQVAEPMPPERIQEPDIQRLIDDMIETLQDYDGVGLAAPQVHVSLRIVVLQLDAAAGPLVLVNPEISFLSTGLLRSFEGCLSAPDLRGAVNRVGKVKVDALGRDGEPVGLELEGFAAIAVQHECDHLDGVVFLDRCDTRTLTYIDELRRFGPQDPSFRRRETADGEPGAGPAEDSEPGPVEPAPGRGGAEARAGGGGGWPSTPLVFGRGSPAEG